MAGKGRELWYAVKNQSHRKLKVICLLKHPRQYRSGGYHLKCETHANVASREWETVINRVACVCATLGVSESCYSAGQENTTRR